MGILQIPTAITIISPWTLFDNHSSYIYPNGNITDYDNWDLGIVNYDSYGILKYINISHWHTPTFTINLGQAITWWLRSPDSDVINYAYYVNSSGYVDGFWYIADSYGIFKFL